MQKIDPGLLTDWEKNLPHHELILVEGGEFEMGGADSEAEEDEKPVHKVSLDSFYLGKFPVTQALWKLVMGKNPSRFKGEANPVENVSWKDTQVFLQKLNQMTGKTYRLPTEAEWEFAARGGIHSEGYLYAGSDKLKEVGWYEKNSNHQTQPVGQKLGNELGLFDMSGNVYEWCQDWYGANYYQHCAGQGVVKNPQGPEKGVLRVFRGGFCSDVARHCWGSSRGSYRPNYHYSDVGFRLALSL
ncbi:MAG: formylglycine-generating enzyme family protein [Bacteroidetes bacterium]|nr:formylglycine-generating enzyme family protein [Bacteroidota bacterium]MCB0844677.1 formylglycine-generating enzyme family protein [Bacteroidota bacterium]